MNKVISHIYVSSNEKDGGVIHYTLSGPGRLDYIDKYPLDRPGYMARDNDKLFVLLREPFPGQSGVVTLNIDATGSLSQPEEVMPTRGSGACYIIVYDNWVYCTNYYSGSTIRLPDRLVVHPGRGTHPVRQNASHPHCIIPTPDRKYVCIADLGTDSIYVMDKKLNPVSVLKLPDESGPRHIMFLNSALAYCVNELSSTVSVLQYENGKFNYIRSYSTLPESYDEVNTASTLRLHKNRLYVSNRGHNSIAVFEIEDERLNMLFTIPSGGKNPREFNTVGDYLLSANELSDNITIYKINDNDVHQVGVVAIGKPWCILPLMLEE